MKQVIKTKKEMVKRLREIGTEEPMICVDEMDLRTLFEQAKPAMWFDFFIREEQKLESQLKLLLNWFTSEAKREPKAVYFKLESKKEFSFERLTILQELCEKAGEEIDCIFAYDEREDLPDSEQFRLQVLIA